MPIRTSNRSPGETYITAFRGSRGRGPVLRLSDALVRRLGYPERVLLARHPSGHYALVPDETSDGYSRRVSPPKYMMNMAQLARLLPGLGRHPVRMDCMDGKPAAIIIGAED